MIKLLSVETATPLGRVVEYETPDGPRLGAGVEVPSRSEVSLREGIPENWF
jgi:hypothetical protein